MTTASEAPVTYLVIDGENLDATLGNTLLQRKPNPDERPRWDRVVDFAARTWDRPVRALFFLNASAGTMPMPFVQALSAIGIRPVPLSGPPGVKVVDVGIQRMLRAIASTDGHVVLGSHDGDFLDEVRELVDSGRQVALLAFREFVSTRYAELTARGLQVLDLEDDVRAFNKPLPRLRIIDLDAFDPTAFL